jgi:hypothetical protein
VQIRDLDDEVYAGLARRAGEAGVSVPELLRVEATRLAARPSMAEWLARTSRRSSTVDRAEIVARRAARGLARCWWLTPPACVRC